MNDDASKGVRRRGVKWDGKLLRRVWSTAEEEALLECLREIVRTNWKSENSFRMGYLGVLEQLLDRSCPNSGLKAEPHISSKIHVWKKTYRCINDMMGRSGSGWNPTTNIIDVKDNVFDNFAKIVAVTFAVAGSYYRLILSQRRCGINRSRTTNNGVRRLERIEQRVNVALILFSHHKNPSTTVEIERSENVPITLEYYVPKPDPNLWR
ncbi:UNVERIFIED_CONTAM: hypothetical protein Slati_1725800 [Sesamum latifolium]|uniref:Myb/SANT-like domain-containing protein n=1 Tax=Sesamum latifolium TaxID=2727402 RepID=A0AAW2WYH2_9LAMI